MHTIRNRHRQKDALLLSHELKIKLCQYVWRKLLPGERPSADDKLNHAGFTLLQVDEYLLAERILEYGIKHTGKAEEKTRLMMIVNYSNAMKLGGKKRRAISELDKIDWSASSDIFQISVAAVKDDLPAVLRLLDGAVKGGSLTQADIRAWPVFKGLRGEKQFQDRFRELFKAELIAVPSVVTTPEAASVKVRAGPSAQDESLIASKHILLVCCEGGGRDADWDLTPARVGVGVPLRQPVVRPVTRFTYDRFEDPRNWHKGRW